MTERPIANPFRGIPGYNCFGCSPDNLQGLKMEFREEGETVVSTWDPASYFQGYLNVLHGGIQAALLDEIACWTVFVKLRTGGVTSRMEIRYRHAVPLGEGPIAIYAGVEGVRRNLARIWGRIHDHSDRICSEGVVTYFCLKPAQAAEKLHYPGYEKFLP
ncbi:MAG TPA: PaaI family thioesterase [bacterium]|nr:PaaI family thioesterase [bacterium]HPJ71331.1 PaaI family thioesterase [bacterium]HPQ66440.1 PaaI family thioesterase [bacterium]